MIEQIALPVVQKRVAVVVQADALYLLRHCGIIYLDARDADKYAAPEYGDVVRDDLDVESIGQIRRQPDRLTLVFRYGEPYQLGCIRGIVLRDVGNLVLLKALAVEIGVPKALYGLGYLRVDAVVVGQHAVSLCRQLAEVPPDSLHMGRELLVVDAVEVFLNVARDVRYRLLHAAEVVFQIPLTRLAQQQHDLIRSVVFGLLDEN